MKKTIVWMLTLVLVLTSFAPCAMASGWSSSGSRKNNSSTLSPSRICPVTPTVYSMRRYRKIGSDKAYDTQKDFSSSMIVRQQGNQEYGLYLKFTPGRVDDGYYISTIGMVLSDPSGNILEENEYDVSITCKYGEYWHWDFYNLDDVFSSLISTYGYVPNGVYTMDIYFNSLWAGKTQFRVQK